MNVPKPTRSFPRVDDAGYPRSALDDLVRRSERGFVNALAEHPEGDNWSDMNPEELLSRAREYLDTAEGELCIGNATEGMRQVGHALNFMLFAMDAIPVADNTIPPMRGPVTDGGLEYEVGATPEGTIVRSPDPSPTGAILQVLRDGRPGGLDHTTLFERAAEVAEIKISEGREAYERLRRQGEIYDATEDEVKLTDPDPAEADWEDFE